MIYQFEKQKEAQYEDISKINNELENSKPKPTFDLHDDINALQDFDDSEPKSMRQSHKPEEIDIDFDLDDLEDLLS